MLKRFCRILNQLVLRVKKERSTFFYHRKSSRLLISLLGCTRRKLNRSIRKRQTIGAVDLLFPFFLRKLDVFLVVTFLGGSYFFSSLLFTESNRVCNARFSISLSDFCRKLFVFVIWESFFTKLRNKEKLYKFSIFSVRSTCSKLTKSEVTATILTNFYEKDEHKILPPQIQTKKSKILFRNNSTKILHCIFVKFYWKEKDVALKLL